MNKSNKFTVKGFNVALIPHKSDISFVGIAVKNGSNYETPSQEGFSHFCEHMFFKGTKNRTYEQLNKEFALIGANQNAYTDNTFVLYHMTLPKQNVTKSVELISDMFFNSVFEPEEIEKEKQVINEEINMYEDNPVYWFYNRVGTEVFNRKIGHPIIGTNETVNSVTSSKLKKYLSKTINRNNVMFVVVGDHTKKDIVKVFSNIFDSENPESLESIQDGEVNSYNGKMWKSGLDFNSQICISHPSAMQSMAQIIYPLFPAGHKYVDTSKIVINSLGGGMYSYMFDKIREKQGLAYSTGAFRSEMEYGKLDSLSLYAMLDNKNIQKFYESSDDIIKDIRENGLKQDIFECAKMDLISTIARKAETSEGLSNYFKSIFSNESKPLDISGRIKKIQKISIKECNHVFEDIFSQKRIQIYMKTNKSQ